MTAIVDGRLDVLGDSSFGGNLTIGSQNSAADLNVFGRIGLSGEAFQGSTFG